MFVEHEKRIATEPSRESKTLKLSEAIRIGCRLRPQMIGSFFEYGSSCVLGAAWEGLGHQYEEDNDYAVWGGLVALYGEDLCSLVMFRNDVGHMDREEIAMWLQTEGK